MSSLTTAPERLQRQPQRYLAPKIQDRPEMVRVLLIAPGELDLAEQSAPVRAVLDARAGSCRYPIGEGESFAFCGAPATRKAGGRMTYCAECGAIVYGPKVRTGGQRSAADRLFVTRRGQVTA